MPPLASRRLLAASALSAGIIAACAAFTHAARDTTTPKVTFSRAGVTQVLPAADRPRDPWVFRCVLDGNPRSVVVALSDDLWLSYDARDGMLVRAWKGDVELTGSVYDTSHGPQPTSRGDVIFDRDENDVFQLSDANGSAIDARYVWRGYWFAGNHVHLHSQLRVTADSTPIDIVEIPEVGTENGLHMLQRTVDVSGLPNGYRLTMPEVGAGAPKELTNGRNTMTSSFRSRETSR